MFRPRIFIGSSTEGLPVAESLQINLERHAEATVWHQGVFRTPLTVVESLREIAARVDFAAFVLTPDDMVAKRGRVAPSPRDNVLFELGFFMSALGPERTFLVACRDTPLRLPTDLEGVQLVHYTRRGDGNTVAATATAAHHIVQAMGRLIAGRAESGRC